MCENLLQAKLSRPGYASSMAYDIDNRESDTILGTIAGDDAIMLVLREGATPTAVRHFFVLMLRSDSGQKQTVLH